MATDCASVLTDCNLVSLPCSSNLYIVTNHKIYKILKKPEDSTKMNANRQLSGDGSMRMTGKMVSFLFICSLLDLSSALVTGHIHVKASQGFARYADGNTTL